MEHDRETFENSLKEQKTQVGIPGEINNENIERAVSCIRDNLFNGDLTISRLKKKCGISDGSFATKFAKATGQYPKDFILTHRIQAAKKLLKKQTLL